MSTRTRCYRIPTVNPHALWLWGYRSALDRCSEQLSILARTRDENDSLGCVAKLDEWAARFMERSLRRLATVAQMFDVDVQPGEVPTLVAERPSDLVELGATAAVSAVQAAIGYARASSRSVAVGSVTAQLIARLRDEAGRVWRHQVDTLCVNQPWLRPAGAAPEVSITDPSQGSSVFFLVEVLQRSAHSTAGTARAKR